MSVDALPGSPSDPQSLNRYTYVANDSVNLTDPSGLCTVSFDYSYYLYGYISGGIFHVVGGWIEITNFRTDCGTQRLGEGGGPGGGGPGGPIPGAGADLSKLLPPAQEPQKPCQDLQRGNPQEYAFVEGNYRVAQQIASGLGTTPANILGLSGLESAFGTSNLAVNYNNYFGLTYPFPGNVGRYDSPNGYPYSIFTPPGFRNSGESVARSRHGARVRGTTTSEAFARALTAPPMAFNSEPGRFGRYVRAINSVQDYIDCLFGPY